MQSDNNPLRWRMSTSEIEIPAGSTNSENKTTGAVGPENQNPTQEQVGALSATRWINSDLLPLLPDAIKHQHHIGPDRTTDPLYVNLGQRPQKKRSKPNRARRNKKTALLLIALCSVSVVGVLISTQPSPIDNIPRPKLVLRPQQPALVPLKAPKPQLVETLTPQNDIELVEIAPATASLASHTASSLPDDFDTVLKPEKVAPQALQIPDRGLDAVTLVDEAPKELNVISADDVVSPTAIDDTRNEEVHAPTPAIRNEAAKISDKSLTIAAVVPPTPVKAEPRPVISLEQLSTEELLAEGQRLLNAADIPRARAAFKAAVDRGAAKGALALGSTYDPKALAAIGLTGEFADTKKAVKWYRQAHLMAHAATQR